MQIDEIARYVQAQRRAFLSPSVEMFEPADDKTLDQQGATPADRARSNDPRTALIGRDLFRQRFNDRPLFVGEGLPQPAEKETPGQRKRAQLLL